MRRAGDGAVDAGARQPGEVVLFGGPGRRRARAGGHDDQRRVAEAVELGRPVELARHRVDVADELGGLRRRLALLGIEEDPRETGARQRGHDGQQRVGPGERVGLAGMHRVQQDDAADLPRVAVRVAEREHPAERMPGEHVRAGRVGTDEQDVQIAGRVGTPGGSGVAAAVPGAVVDADGRGARDVRGDPARHRRRRLTEARLEHDRRAAGAGAADAQAMPADVDQAPAGDPRQGRVGRVAQRLVGPADRREREDTEHGIQQPRLQAPGGPAAGARDHPDHERRQQRRPEPAERGQRRGARREDDQPGARDAHRCGRDRRPSLRPVGEARRQHGQQRPADGEPEQQCAGDHGFPAARERSGDERDGRDQPGEQRARHDHRRPASRAVGRAGRPRHADRATVARGGHQVALGVGGATLTAPRTVATSAGSASVPVTRSAPSSPLAAWMSAITIDRCQAAGTPARKVPSACPRAMSGSRLASTEEWRSRSSA